MGNVTFTFTAEDAKAIQAFTRLENKEQVLEQKLDRLRRKGEQTAKGATRDNKTWLDSAMRLAAPYLTTAAAIGTVAKALRDMHEERKRAAESARQSAPAMGALAQLAESPQEMQRMLSEARTSVVQGGMTRDMAATLQFKLESMQLASQREMFANLFGAISDPGLFAEGVATLRDAFGTKEAGSPRAIANKLLAASRVSKTTLEEFAPAATIGAQAANLIGARDEEYMSALAHVAKPAKSAEVAATQIDAFITGTLKNMKMGAQYGGIMDRVNFIEKMGVDETKLFQMLGRKEAVRGYMNLKSMRDQIIATQADLTTAGERTGEGDVVDQTVAALRSDKILRAERDSRIAREQARMDEMMHLAPDQLKREQTLEEIQSSAIRAGRRPATRAAMRAAGGAAEFAGAGETGIRAAAAIEGAGIDFVADSVKYGGPQNALAVYGARMWAGILGIGKDKKPEPVEVIVRDDKSRGQRPDRNAGTP